MIQLNDEQLKLMHGKVLSATALLGYVAVVAGCAAILKILTSTRGRVSIGGINITWGK